MLQRRYRELPREEKNGLMMAEMEVRYYLGKMLTESQSLTPNTM